MKKLLKISLFCCAALLTGCNKDIEPDAIHHKQERFSLLNGAIIIDHNPRVTISKFNEYLTPSESVIGAGIKTGVSAIAPLSEDEVLEARNYRFKLVAEMDALIVTDSEGIERKVQAAEVKISNDGHVFVAYNHRNEPNIGGLVVYRYTVTNGALADASVELTPVSSIELRNAQINALDYHNNKLYIAGASEETELGYDGSAPAFYMVMELETDKRFKPIVPDNLKYLTSFQANSIRMFGNHIYVTTGDGTQGTKGGLYIFDANTYEEVNFIEMEHARSVDIDESGVYLMQSNHARVTKFDFYGGGETRLYGVTGEAMQKNARSQILAWNNYLFLAQNETGLKMLNKTGFNSVNDRLGPPNNNDHKEWDVTNGVSVNSDPKISSSNTLVSSKLLLVANGRQGLYWYDIMSDDNVIVKPRRNRILAQTGQNSTNFVVSKENVVFVANGLGGLKVLYIGVRDNDEEIQGPEPDCQAPCEYHIYADGIATAIINQSYVGITRFRLIDDCDNIQHAWCANMGIETWDGLRYKCVSAEEHFLKDEDTKIMAAFTYVMNNHKQMETSNVHGYRQMKQSIVWRIIHDFQVNDIFNAQGTQIRNVINFVYSNINTITAAYRAGVTISGNPAAVGDGLFGPFTIDENILFANIYFDLSSNNAEFVNQAGDVVTQVMSGVQFYARPVNTSENINITAVASETQQLWYVDNYRFYVEMGDEVPHRITFQPLIQELVHPNPIPAFYTVTRSFSVNP